MSLTAGSGPFWPGSGDRIESGQRVQFAGFSSPISISVVIGSSAPLAPGRRSGDKEGCPVGKLLQAEGSAGLPDAKPVIRLR